MLRLLPLTLCALLLAACNNSNNTDGGAGCPAATGAGTTHTDNLSADETWTAAGSPHLVTSSIKVNSGVKLTIEPCAEVKLGPSNHIEVDGTLVAEGTADKPIKFNASDSTMPWGYLNVFAPGTISLAFATLTNGGGDDTNSYGALEARGDQTMPAQPVLKVNTVTVVNSAAYGVSLRAGGAFTADSTGLEVRGSAKAPLRINPRLATNIPSGNYTNNALDAIVVETEAYGDITLEDVTFHDRGVPYQIGGDKTVGTFVIGTGPGSVTTTLEAGVNFKFIKAGGARLQIDKGSTANAAKGTLIAQGTAAKPVVFTSAAGAPAAGDWVGLEFGNVPTAGDKLDHVEVHFAGGASQANGFHCSPTGGVSANEDAAITFYGPPPAGAVSNSLIADSKGAGINLAYSGASVDLLTGNTFNNVAGCKLTTPKDATGSCPATSPCP